MKDKCPHVSLKKRTCTLRHGGGGYCLHLCPVGYNLGVPLTSYNENPGCATFHYHRAETMEVAGEALATLGVRMLNGQTVLAEDHRVLIAAWNAARKVKQEDD